MLCCKAVLVDIDGTLIDSAAAVERSWRTWASEYGVDAEEVLRICHGRRSADVAAQFIAPQQQAAAVARELALELGDLDGVVALPGTRRFLDGLPRGQWAAVTSGGRSLMTARLAAAQLPAPELMISAEDVVTGKPSPEGYLKAAAALGVEAQQCLVIEDAPAGISAGRAAGARVLAVTTTHQATEVADADVVVTDLSSVNVTPIDDYIALRIA
ncbi:HAD-IA family hydrolase [Mycobacterium spongiae]|uniref:HAD-IA family hydrolase n=2 Tax=Mycobacterium spongiae TaxID=886343 RepID=A0A975K210_9MYCO|nr:HAD-IA family hydrolase [Mycobacterium spongiae]